MSGKSQGSRVCAFCGGKGLTNEHVLPVWMSKYFADLSGYVASGWIGAQDGDIPTYDPPGPLPGPAVGNRRREVGSAGTFNQTVGVICKTCNSGWMSDLEAAVEPILAPMFGGQPALTSAMPDGEIHGRAKPGVELTGVVFERIVAKAADGLDVTKVRRCPGRPAMGSGSAGRIVPGARLEPDIPRTLDERAAKDENSASGRRGRDARGFLRRRGAT